MTADAPSHINIEGGTHNPAAPPFDFLEVLSCRSLSGWGRRSGLSSIATVSIRRAEAVSARRSNPVAASEPLHIGERGEVLSRRSRRSGRESPWAHRTARDRNRGEHAQLGQRLWKDRQTRNSPGPGNVVMVEIGSSEVTEIFSAFGHDGVSAETGRFHRWRSDAREYLASRAAAGEHLTDQLLLPLALAGAGSFTAEKINMHARTNMAVIARSAGAI